MRKTCRICAKEFDVPNYRNTTAKVCGRACADRLRSQGVGNSGSFKPGTPAHNRVPRVTRSCELCGATYETTPRLLARTRYCGRKCANAANARRRNRLKGEANPSYKSGIGIYRRQLKTECERCASTRFLLIHHRDENRENNTPNNLETLCKRCHQHHHGSIEKAKAASLEKCRQKRA